MTNTQEKLAAIGFGRRRAEPACWHTVRLNPAITDRSGECGMDPDCSPMLLNWRKVMRLDPRVSPYRITRVER